MDTKEFHRNAFWVFGVIVGLALREVLNHFVPEFIDRGIGDWRVALDSWRIVLFLLVVLRFHFGSAVFFDEVHVRDSSSKNYLKRSYSVDFICGLIHFMLLYASAISFGRHDRVIGGLSYFSLSLWIVLLYDNVWCWASRRYDTCQQIKTWTVFNDYTVLACVVVWAVSIAAGADAVLAEHLALLPAIAASIMDLSQLLDRVLRNAS